jgi:hypothetical protein
MRLGLFVAALKVDASITRKRLPIGLILRLEYSPNGRRLNTQERNKIVRLQPPPCTRTGQS